MMPRGTWLDEELSEDAISVHLDMLLTLIFERTDDEAATGRLKVDRSELVRARRTLVQQRVPLLEKHEALPEPPALLESEEMKVHAAKMRPRRASLML